MTSILKVDTIQDTAGNNIINESGDTITIGASGDTVTIPSGATTTLTDGVSGDFKMNSGYGSIATAYGCRAWVNFNGTGTPSIRESGNVSSITDDGTGTYTINFTTAMPDVNYIPIMSNPLGLLSTGSQQFPYTQTTIISTSQITIDVRQVDNDAPTFVAVDSSSIFVAIIR
jgi:hypothetical protein